MNKINNKKERQKMKLTLAIVFTVLFTVWGGIRIIADIQFKQGCGGYLKRAADSNTVELAVQNLQIAVDYTEANHLTEGYTSVIYRTPDEDVGFWHRNLKASLDELKQVKPEATMLERTNVLMKLRETLLDQGKDSVSVTVPKGISVFPNNGIYMFFGWFVAIFATICSIWWLATDSELRF